MSKWKNAKQFSKDVELGKTYWVVKKHTYRGSFPGAPKEVIWTYVFDNRQVITGAPMCGSMSAAQLWNLWGPVYDRRPSEKIPTIDEWELYWDLYIEEGVGWRK